VTTVVRPPLPPAGPRHGGGSGAGKLHPVGPALPPGALYAAHQRPDRSNLYRKISSYQVFGPFLAYRWCIDIVIVGFKKKKKNYCIGQNIVFSGNFCCDLVVVVVKNWPFLANIQDIVAVVVSN
jgi:hypothetical protein